MSVARSCFLQTNYLNDDHNLVFVPCSWGVIHKLRWQDFAHYWPLTHPLLVQGPVHKRRRVDVRRALLFLADKLPEWLKKSVGGTENVNGVQIFPCSNKGWVEGSIMGKILSVYFVNDSQETIHKRCRQFFWIFDTPYRPPSPALSYLPTSFMDGPQEHGTKTRLWS